MASTEHPPNRGAAAERFWNDSTDNLAGRARKERGRSEGNKESVKRRRGPDTPRRAFAATPEASTRTCGDPSSLLTGTSPSPTQSQDTRNKSENRAKDRLCFAFFSPFSTKPEFAVAWRGYPVPARQDHSRADSSCCAIEEDSKWATQAGAFARRRLGQRLSGALPGKRALQAKTHQ